MLDCSRSVRRFLRHGQALLLAGSLLLLEQTGASAQQPLFTFAQISDSQPQSSAENQRFVDVLRTIAQAGDPGALIPRAVDLVLFAGDITWGNTSSEWIAAKAKLDTWLTANDIPYLAVPGNHDVDNSDTSRYEQYIADSGVWDRGSAAFTGHNGRSRTTSWRGLRFIGFNNSNPGWNTISSADVATIASRVSAAAAASENVFLLCHHPHDEKSRLPLVNVLPNRSAVGYLHGHLGDPHVTRGLAGISNPNIWDVGTNAIYDDRAIVYFEVFETELLAHVIVLDDNPGMLPAPVVMPLTHRLTPTGPPVPPLADFSGSPTTGQAPLTVAFSDLSGGTPNAWAWDFGDGTTSSQRNPQHVYTSPGTYSVTLAASNSAGTDQLTRHGYVDVDVGLPIVAFTPVADARVSEGSPSSNAGRETTLRVKSQSGSSYQSFLKFDLSALGAAPASAKLRLFCTDGGSSAGSVYAVANDSWGETTITWNNRPAWTTPALASGGSVADGSWIELDVSSAVTTNDVVSLALAGGSTSSVYYSSREGSNPPQLVVTLASASSPPTASFTATPTSGPAPLAVAFTDASAGATGWSWDFGDGTSSSERHPTHVYGQPGSYTVVLDVTNAYGMDSLTRLDYVVVGPPSSTRVFTPVADTRAYEGSPNGNFGLDSSLRVKSASGGSYQSFLRFDLASLAGGVRSARLRLFCTDGGPAGGNVYRVADTWTETGLTWNNKPALTGASLANLGAASQSAWVEVDVTGAVSGSGLVSFALAGGSSNSVLYTSRQGANPPQLVIETGEPVPPVAGFSASPTSGSAPLSVAFTDLSSGAAAWAWTFGDGGSSSQQNPTHVYTLPGTYTVTLQVANAAGSATLTRSDLILVGPPSATRTLLPVADARVNEGSPTSNAGADAALRVRAESGGSYHAYLRFDLASVTAPVTRATLRLYSTDGSDVAGIVFATSDAWSEGTITWNNKPAVIGSALASPGSVANGAWVEFDVTSAVAAGGLESFALRSTSSNSCYYSSREGANPPQLVLTSSVP